MGIPNLIDINSNDIKQMVFYANKEVNPLYPVPELLSYRKLVKMYYKNWKNSMGIEEKSRKYLKNLLICYKIYT